MSREIIRAQILECIEEEGLDLEGDTKKIADIAIDCTLNHLSEFVVQVSHQLAGDGLYSHSMVAGLVINKIKDIKNG